jgi:D-alanyl-D-alanine dipeptidase
MPILDLAYEVPVIAPQLYAGSYASIPCDMTDPRWGEPLVRLETAGVAYESHHARRDGGNWPYFAPVPGARQQMWLRATAAAKLARVNERLKPFATELIVLDGYRSIACQQGLWDFYHREAARALPDGTPALWRRQALQYAADPGNFNENDPATWLAHSTGAAVDLSLRDLVTGAYCDLGGRFEEINGLAVTDYFERQLLAGAITAADSRLQYRRLLHWAMTSEGFENDPSVVWHYDWGNQLYVKTMRALRPDPAKAAWYGYIAPP